MPLFAVNEEKCTRCHACVEVCPLGLVRMDSARTLPHPIRGAARFCIRCGHCVGVCPRGALEHKTLTLADSPPLPRTWRLTPGQVEPLIKGRRSIRAFREKAVERALVEKALDLSRYAPSGTNSQPVKWLVIEGREKVAAVTEAVMGWVRACRESPASPLGPYADFLIRSREAGEDPVCHNAPNLVLAWGEPGPMLAHSCLLAGATFELAVLPLGLGACWAGFVGMAASRDPRVRAALGLPAGSECHAALMLGYPRYEYRRIPPRKKADITWK
jgi:nitroreductase/NAD-dependent dihydropyrimidine dehydrogenase PreA subunit